MLPLFMNASGLVTKILDKMIEAQQPERFTQDFLKTRLGYDSGGARPIIPLLKRLGFLASDGAPTKLYSRFRNPEERGRAMAEALRNGYREVYERNEYAHDLPKEKFKNLIVEMTGLKTDDPTVRAIVSTFFNLKNYARFDIPAASVGNIAAEAAPPTSLKANSEEDRPSAAGLNLSYTINLNLPETTDVEVFNAIFRSLKEHLLRG